jgi:hypothetical protein
MEKFKKDIIKGIIVITILYIGFVICYSFEAWSGFQLKKHGIETSALVIKKEEKEANKRRGGRKKFHYITYKFRTSDSHEHTSRVRFYHYSDINIGDSVKIIFDPENFDNTVLESESFSGFTPYFSKMKKITSLFAIMLIFFLPSLWRLWRSPPKERN